jgi:hypothetical protein
MCHHIQYPFMRPHIGNRADHGEVLASAVQYRPEMFACTVRRHHGAGIVLAGKVWLMEKLIPPKILPLNFRRQSREK